MIDENTELLRRVKYVPLVDKPMELIESRLYQNQLTFEVKLNIEFENISSKEISAVYVNLCGFDDEVSLLFAKTVEFKSISVKKGDKFLAETTVPSLKTSSVTVTVNKICYADGEEWLSGQPFSAEDTDVSADSDEKFEDTAEIPIVELPAEEKVLFSDKDRKISERRAQRLAEKELWKEKTITPEERKKKRTRRITAALMAVIIVGAVSVGAYMAYKEAEHQRAVLDNAISLYREQHYDEAEALFDSLQDLSGEKSDECRLYHALNCIKLANYSEAIYELSSLQGRMDSSAYMRQLNGILSGIISAGEKHTVGLKKDGTVVAVGDNTYEQCETEGWTNIIAVSAGLNHTVGLADNGTVVATGDNEEQQCKVENWKNIIGISAGRAHTVGLLNNGRVVAAGDDEFEQCKTEKWSGIVAVSAGSNHSVGLKQDGTVVASGDNSVGQCDVGDWTDIISVTAGSNFTMGVKSDGTVVATGDSVYNQTEVSELNNIVLAEAGDYHGLFLTYTGRMQYTGDNDWHQGEGELWKNIIALSGGLHHSVGVSQDGTVYATGDNKSGQCQISDWTDIGLPESALRITSME